METCVLIPAEFSLILSTDVLDLFEMRVGLWSSADIPRGAEFSPDQGHVRRDKLEVYGLMKENDIRRVYGCEDRVEKLPDRQVRHCNWVRFLKTSADPASVNLLARRRLGKVVYRAVRDIPANTEIIAAFDHHHDLFHKVLRLNPRPGDEVQGDRPEDEVRKDHHGDEVHGVQAGDEVDAGDSDIEVDEVDHSDDEESAPLPVSISMTTDYQTPPSAHSGNQITPPSGRHMNYRQRTPENALLSPVTPDSGRKSLSSDSFTSVSDISPNSSSGSSLIGQNDHVFTPPSSRGPIMTSRPALVCVASPFKHVPIQKYRLFDGYEEDLRSPRSPRSPRSSVSGEESLISSSGSGSSTSPRTPVKRNRERTWLPCEICQKKFDRPSLLRRHIRTHTGEKPHACDICGKAFSTSSSLNTHRRIHSGEKPHQCRVCGKRFTASSNLYYHRMTHNKEKPHKCSLCSKSFPTPGDLKSHMYVHNGSWPFRCDVCDRGFSKQTNLKNHMLLHTGDKPHECSLCGKRFALQCNLRTHLKTHESETQEECFKCGKVYLTTQQKMTNGHCDLCAPVSPSERLSSPTKPTNFHSISDMLRAAPEPRGEGPRGGEEAGSSYYNALSCGPGWAARGGMLMPLLGLGGRYLNPGLLQVRDGKHSALAHNYSSLWLANGYRT